MKSRLDKRLVEGHLIRAPFWSEIDPATMQETCESNATLHFSFRQRLKLGVEPIRIATACATWRALSRKRYPNHPTYCLAQSANHRAYEASSRSNWYRVSSA